jgi:hypothetical protein
VKEYTQVVGKDYEIEKYMDEDDGEDRRGWTDGDNIKIHINCQLAKPIQEETLIHEWLEAYKVELKLSLKHRTIYLLAGALYEAGFRVPTRVVE